MTLRTIIDRPNTSQIRNLDRCVVELSKYMTELEIDRCVDLLTTMSKQNVDVNLTVDDAAAQLRILLGSERYEMLKAKWSQDNQQLIKTTPDYLPKIKYVRVSDGSVWDGLDPEDRVEDYKQIIM